MSVRRSRSHYARLVDRKRSEPKLHHYVPQAYLGWFGRDHKVAVRWRDRAEIYVSGVKGVAAETGLYYTEVSGGRSTVTEAWLADVDGKAVAAIGWMVRSLKAPGASSSHRGSLARLLALQLTRTPEARERLTFPGRVQRLQANGPSMKGSSLSFSSGSTSGFGQAQARWQELSPSRKSASHIKDGPLTQTEIVQISMALGRKHAAVVYRKHWSIEICSSPGFITSDAPLVLWRVPSERDHYEGVGLENAEEIRFPLDPEHQLVLTNDDREVVTHVDLARVSACNKDLASACHRFIVGHPDRQAALSELELAEKRPTLRFNVGPGYETRPDGSQREMGEVLHFWVQRHDRAPQRSSARTRRHPQPGT
jgi:hypothetical protein